MMVYSCTQMATVGVKGLSLLLLESCEVLSQFSLLITMLAASYAYIPQFHVAFALLRRGVVEDRYDAFVVVERRPECGESTTFTSRQTTTSGMRERWPASASDGRKFDEEVAAKVAYGLSPATPSAPLSTRTLCCSFCSCMTVSIELN